jgi:uncharacterized membrane protein
MKLNQSSGMTIATAAAALILSGAMLAATATADAAKGHCVGANACKGQGACKAASNDCKGMNACKGQGYLDMTEEECAQKGGKFEKS